MLDMVDPKKTNMISLSDLRSCPMTPIFFDTFFNLEKYLDHEQRDPFASQRDMDEDGNEVPTNKIIKVLTISFIQKYKNIQNTLAKITTHIICHNIAFR